MKGYSVVPAFDLADPEDSRVQACISMIAEIACACLRANGDRFHYAVDWRDPGGPSWSGHNEEIAEPHLVDLSDTVELARLVRISVDPWDARCAPVIRSITTCRALTFGWDAQAFLCLRHEDEPPVAADPSLVLVEEWPGLRTETDYLDGSVSGRPIS